MKIVITEQAKKRFLKKVPLVQENDLVTKKPADGWVQFVDQQQNFIAKGYLGQQNKGLGWLVTWKNEPIDQQFYQQLFRAAKKKRASFYQLKGTTAFRLFNGEGDGLGGLTIDLYQDYLVLSWYNDTLYQEHAVILAALLAVFPEILGVYEKIRFTSSLPESRFVTGKQAIEPLIVEENHVKYATYLNEGLMTGIFLDQKEVRGRLVDGLAAGKRVLNMFSYTGAFSVAAAMGGAYHTTSVDLAKRSLGKTQEQFSVNHINPSDHAIHVMDVFGYFNYAKKKNLGFDLIVLDPPSFARNKKKVFSVAKNYGELITDSLAILNRNGVIIASTNAANLPLERFQKIIETAMQEKKVKYQLVERHLLPADFAVNPQFKEGNYLKVLFYQIID
ncbi:MAG: class I SAM-dependent rRNA methyltransferase [Enterococcus sp.]